MPRDHFSTSIIYSVKYFSLFCNKIFVQRRELDGSFLQLTVLNLFMGEEGDADGFHPWQPGIKKIKKDPS
jgi:hypothetical protein